MTNRKWYGRAQALPSLPESVTVTICEKISKLGRSVKADYLKQEFQSKFVSADTDPADVRRAKAVFKWLCTEQSNASTNERLLLTHEEYNILPRVSFGRFVGFCQRLIRDIIGDYPPSEAFIGSFSGGATTSRARTEGHPSFKYLGKQHVTSRCAELFLDLKEDMPGWFGTVDEFIPELVRGNVMFTVLKNTEIDRVCCKEPDLNMFIQKGLGSYIRKSLLRKGVNLQDQSINNRLARVGSITGELSTLDLSSASDSVSRELVALMLPEHWFTALDSARSHYTLIDGEEHRNEMFSSMGNGFTFELESLLFFTLAKATTYFRGVPGIVSVYGDDIIAPTEVFESLEWVLGYFGFALNRDKSFCTGDFRESCGGHYKDGFDITPFYLRKPVADITDVIHMANSLRQWATIPGFGILDPDPGVYDLWCYLKSLVPADLWGGEDTSFKYQLVSMDLPINRLHEETKRSDTELGGYVHWLNTTWDRNRSPGAYDANESYEWTVEGVETSSRTRGRKLFRKRPVRSTTVPRLPALFLEELG